MGTSEVDRSSQAGFFCSTFSNLAMDPQVHPLGFHNNIPFQHEGAGSGGGPVFSIFSVVP